MSALALPAIIQGGMGIAVSDWRLARAVSTRGQLGVVSGTSIDAVFVRRLQDGDLGGHVRRAIAAFPLPRLAEQALQRYFKPGGRAPDEPYEAIPMHQQVVSLAREQLTILASFVEVHLAKQGHHGKVGMNLLSKIALPNPATLYGAMLAGVDAVLMGAGIPRDIPSLLDKLARHEDARMRLEVEGEAPGAASWFGLSPRFPFATRPDKALGDPALWDRAEGLVREAFESTGTAYRVKPKDGTFYAPKIDIYIDDALGREWQMATIQVDLVMLPERFDLTYVDAAGQPQRPIAIHRAIYGSLERFIGILVEHFAGAFPLWVAPVQAVIIPIADRHVEASRELAAIMRVRGLRVEVDASDGRMQNKIRVAQEQKVPYMLVLGDREVEARTAAPRTRAGEQQPPEAWESLADRLASEAAARGA